MMAKLCIDCGQLAQATRCNACATMRQAAYDQTRGSSSKRGYDSAWRKKAATLIRSVGACVWCGHKGDPTNPLTVDHITPLAQGGTSERSNLRVLCRRCNSSKSAQDRAGHRG